MILNKRNMTTRIWRMKDGVSLFTVLMFMLVATIAATATYKWITTESSSSTDRMIQREAYQSALAGIESARGWMTYNANETGALIKQYKDGNNAPIKLNDRLAAFVRAGQSYDVYLVGVSASPENPTYKLKLVSVGYARDKRVKHSEVAILNVNGLYQVRLPVSQHFNPTDFEYAYFGGGVEGTSTTYESAVINGNWGANPPSTSRNWIVTGNASLSGSMINVGKTSCIGGNLNANNGITSKNLFVGGDITGTALAVNVAQDAYIGGNMVVGNQPVSFGRHLTMLGKIKTNPQAVQFTVGGNLCAGEDATLVHDKGAPSRQTIIKGNVWMPGPYNIWYKDITCTKAKKKNCTCDNNGSSLACDEFGKVNINDQNQYKVKSCHEYITTNVVDFNKQNEGNGPRYHCTDFKLSAKVPADNYEFGNFPGDNYNNYEYLWNSGQKERGFLLGEESGSKVYVKSGRSWSDLSDKAAAKYQEKTDHPRQCLSGYRAWYMYNEVKTCGNSEIAGHYKNWSNESYSPYETYEAAKINKPSSLYYIYHVPDDRKDVDFGLYIDSYWKWCRGSDIHGNCTGYDNAGTWMYGYFVDAPKTSNDKKYIFTNSGHSNDDGYHTTNVGGNYYRYLNMSNSAAETEITGSPWCKKAENKEWRPVCGVGPYFASNGSMIHDLPLERPFMCADSVKNSVCDSIWVQEKGCDDANYKVPDPLITAKNSFESYATKGCAASITKWDNSLVSNLNSCYSEHKNDAAYVGQNFYNGYVVVKLTSVDKNANVSGTLTGKFIIMVDEQINAQNSMFTAADDNNSFVFLYLAKGASYFSGTSKHVFVYSTGPFTQTSKIKLTGTLYTPTDSCIRIRFENAELKYDSVLVAALTTAKVICKNDGSSCGGTVEVTPSSSSPANDIEVADGGFDPYYIGVAPQLSVTVESQYKNKEAIDVEQSPEIQASFIVLPRIVYLTKDAKGKLSNYYNIVPLNTTKKVSSTSVTCSGIPATGKLTTGGPLEEGSYTCNVEGSVTSTISGGTSSARMKVPFWVVVRGEGGTLPTASFADPTKEVSKGSSTVASLLLTNTTSGTTQSCNVTFSVSPHGSEWEVENTSHASLVPGKDNVYTAVVTSESPVEVLNVKNIESENGSVILTVIETDGCNPGTPEVIYNANTAKIERWSIESYCNSTTGDNRCNNNGEYDKAMKRPDCSTAEEWVTVQGNSCTTTETNNSWSCAISGSVSLKTASSVNGCEAIIVPLSHSATLNVDETYKLYASLKALPMTFHAGFETEGDISGDPVIKIEVHDENGSTRNSECSYNNFKNSESRATYCDVQVYRNSTINLSFSPESDLDDFNYWKCEGGPDCSDEPFTGKSYSISVTGGGNTVYAHFGEQDKHCFFDEFKEGEAGSSISSNRGTVECGNSTNYCIDYCENDGNKCATNLMTSSFPNAKWRLVEKSTASREDINYSSDDGCISLKPSANRGKKESQKGSAIIMSSVQAGLYGTMKAQFQPAREGVNSNDEAKATVKNSGFILRSDPDVNRYLMLNVFIASDGVLKARLCVSGGSSCSEEVLTRNSGSSYSPEPSQLVTISATISKKDGGDVLAVDMYPSAWTEVPYSAEFKLSDSEISGVTNTGSIPNEYVGYALSDPKFKIYGIGWKSETYNSTCWDTYPTISCSFKAAYPAGVIPKNTAVKPWVGFSAWFSTAAKDCSENEIAYWYNGEDACSHSSDYQRCGSNEYSFSDIGAHGYIDNTGKEIKMAKVTAENCNVYGEEAVWAKNGVAANCGSFWVGEQNACSRHHTFESTTSAGDGNYFGLESGTANVRGATIYVTLDNPNGQKVEVYLYSKNETSGYTYGNDFIYSLPYLSSQTGTDIRLEIPVEDISNIDGFDPEHVVGVHVNTFGESSVTIKKVESSCPNAVEITGCSATYRDGKWNIVAVIKNKSHTDKIEVNETHNYISYPSSLTCYYDTDDAESKCKFSDDNAMFDWTDNPYIGHVGDKYTFNITLTSKEKTTSVCTTDPASVTGIEAKCGNVDGTVIQGQGIPQFSYSIANCPDETSCNYKIELVKDGSAIMTITSSTSSGNVETMTATNAANGSEILAEGTYKFRLSSTNAARPFTECESNGSFTVSAPGKIKANCSFETVAKGETAKLSMTDIANNEKSTAIFIERDGASAIEKTLAADNSSQTFEFTAPNSVGSYSYQVYYTMNGEKTDICEATLVVVDEPSCSNVSPTQIFLGQTFTFTPTGGGTCTSASLGKHNDGDIITPGSGSPCPATYIVKPAVVGDNQKYTYTFNGPIGKKTCDAEVDVKAPPDFTCPANTSSTINEDVTIALTGISGCGDGCTVSVTPSVTIKNSSGTVPKGATSHSLVFDGVTSVPSTNPVNYNVTLTNSIGKEKTCPVTYNSSEEPSTCNCTCGDCSNIRLATFSENHNGPGMFCFFVDNENLNMRMDSDTKEDNSNNHCIVSINGVSKKKFGQTALKNLVSTKKDGGYYIYVGNDDSAVQNSHYCSFQFPLGNHTSSANPCGSGGGSGGSGSGSSGSGSGEDTPQSVGSTNHRQSYTADKWYSITMHQNGKFVVQNHTGNTATLSYKDCNGTSKTKSLAAGQNGDEGSGWWNKVEDSVSKDCVIEFKYPDGGEFDMQVW